MNIWIAVIAVAAQIPVAVVVRAIAVLGIEAVHQRVTIVVKGVDAILVGIGVDGRIGGRAVAHIPGSIVVLIFLRQRHRVCLIQGAVVATRTRSTTFAARFGRAEVEDVAVATTKVVQAHHLRAGGRLHLGPHPRDAVSVGCLGEPQSIRRVTLPTRQIHHTVHKDPREGGLVVVAIAAVVVLRA